MANEPPSSPVEATQRHSYVIDGQTVSFYDSADHRLWHCSCMDFERRLKQFAEGFCAHTAVAMMNHTFSDKRGHRAE